MRTAEIPEVIKKSVQFEKKMRKKLGELYRVNKNMEGE